MFSFIAIMIATKANIATYIPDPSETIKTINLASNVVRCESGIDKMDGAVVLQTAVNRSKKFGYSLFDALSFPNAYATKCPISPRAWKPHHLTLGILATFDVLPVPEWAHDAYFYCGPSDNPAVCHAGRKNLVGTLTHSFYEQYIPRSRRAYIEPSDLPSP
jgi:hypothetical protein